MKQLRKIIFILALFLITINLFGCTESHVHEFGEWELIENENDPLGLSLIRYCNGCEVTEEQQLTDSDILDMIYEAMDNVTIESEVDDEIELPSSYKKVTIKWRSKNQYLISDEGVVNNKPNYNRDTTLEATFSFGEYEETQDYAITVLGYTDAEKIEHAKKEITFPNLITGDLTLVKKLQNGVTVSYESSNQNIITNEGEVKLQDEETTVTIKIIYKSGELTMEETREVKVAKYDPSIKQHQLIDYAKDFDLTGLNDLVYQNDKIVLADGVLEATYTSKEMETLAFKSLVGSWACITSTEATCELKISVKVNGQWSEYITYRPWGLGLKNALYDMNFPTVKLSDDEIIILNSQKAAGIKYTVTLKRTTLNVKSPELSLVSFALDIPNYSYDVRKEDISNYVFHNVPKLYQNEVPEIGNSICSATSTTMLLKFNGFDFSDKDSEYEHRYIAWIVMDYGNNIFGNWVYNTVTMGGYGLDAYVARMYSIEELVYHLSKVGPVALSMKGQMTSDVANYYTNGHLIVAKGFQKESDGTYTIICNDPNVKGVECKYSQKVIEQTWRNVAYVYEK